MSEMSPLLLERKTNFSWAERSCNYKEYCTRKETDSIAVDINVEGERR
jgi:hypothetical protein